MVVLPGVISTISLVARAQKVVVLLAHQAAHWEPFTGPRVKAGGTASDSMKSMAGQVVFASAGTVSCTP